MLVNSMSSDPPQTGPFDRDRTQTVAGARVNFTREKLFISLLTIDRPNLGVVLLEFLSRKEGFHSVSVNENLLQFLRYWNSHFSRVQKVNAVLQCNSTVFKQHLEKNGKQFEHER
ncbi:hypothetical protein AVEN_69444-1 [Araneus ventricosus]|uniref:Uncharacterized protein n=1 Tax=Araneus ventricosus TaxID=182803 RepID=A0A4Y2AKL0_ARAVE|nr:hypothetical protein AVEN_69444-1 [Araneus ventricosus]